MKTNSIQRFRWRIKNEKTGECCFYNAAHGIPVTADHVRSSPKVIEWAQGDPFSVLEPNPAAVALGKLSRVKPTPAQKDASRANGKKGGRPAHHWFKEPKRGCTNDQASLFRYTVVRLSDKAERFTDRRPSFRASGRRRFMVWDNRENREVK